MCVARVRNLICRCKCNWVLKLFAFLEVLKLRPIIWTTLIQNTYAPLQSIISIHIYLTHKFAAYILTLVNNLSAHETHVVIQLLTYIVVVVEYYNAFNMSIPYGVWVDATIIRLRTFVCNHIFHFSLSKKFTKSVPVLVLHNQYIKNLDLSKEINLNIVFYDEILFVRVVWDGENIAAIKIVRLVKGFHKRGSPSQKAQQKYHITRYTCIYVILAKISEVVTVLKLCETKMSFSPLLQQVKRSILAYRLIKTPSNDV